MDRRRGRRAGRHGTAGNGRVAAAIPPPLLADPEKAAAARARGATQDQLFRYLWRNAGRNNVGDDMVKGHKGFPLPAKAPVVERSFFVFAKSDRTGLDVADLILKAIYEEDCNEIGDKRHEICHFLARAPQPDDKEFNSLKHELAELMADAGNKVKELLDCTGYRTNLPQYFVKFPKLEE